MFWNGKILRGIGIGLKTDMVLKQTDQDEKSVFLMIMMQ